MDRTFRHWTPRYIVDRIFLMIHERRYPDLPWLPPQAVEILGGWVSATDIGLEWGSGCSTVWLAKRIGKLISMEHDPSWHEKVCANLQRQGLTNVDYRLVSVDDLENPSIGCPYLSVADEFPSASLDFVLVDGLYRDRCAQAAIGLLKPGGLLVIDNANWYLPHPTRSPNSVGANGNPASEIWKMVIACLCSWRCLWASSGVTDTAFFIKPSSGPGETT